VIATPAAVSDYIFLDHIQIRQNGILFYLIGHGIHIGSPITVTSPRIETTMIASLKYRIKHITIFDDMPAKSSFTDVDSCPWHIIYGAMTNCNTIGHGYLDRGCLLFVPACPGYQAIFYPTLLREIISIRTRRSINPAIVLPHIAV